MTYRHRLTPTIAALLAALALAACADPTPSPTAAPVPRAKPTEVEIGTATPFRQPGTDTPIPTPTDLPPSPSPEPTSTIAPAVELSGSADLAIGVTPSPTITPTPADPAEDRPPLDLIDSLPAAYRTPEQSLEVELFYADRWARVEQTILIPNTSPDEWEEVVFNVPLAATEGAFDLQRVAVEGEGYALNEVDADLDGIALHVPLPEPAARHDTVRVEIDYNLFFLPVRPNSTFPIGLTGYTGDVVRAGEWYPVLAPYQGGEGWQTYNYHPVGDPVIYPATNTQMAVAAPEGITIAGSGPIAQEPRVDQPGLIWRFEVDAARGIAFFASDRYRVLTGEAAGIHIYSYYHLGGEGAAQQAIYAAGDALALYHYRFGPYPYDSLTIAQNGYRSDMEYSALISLSNRVYNNYQGSPHDLVHVLVSHEVAHQWWYGVVGNDQVNEPWLDEALASYCEVLYYEAYYPDDREWRLNQYTNKAEPGWLDEPIYSYISTFVYVRDIYPRGVMFIHELRRAMGDTVFFAFLQDYASSYSGRLATEADFRAVLAEHDDRPAVNAVVNHYLR
ncbi:MAG: hypothetical protein JXJ17_00185 [Anaerolineae bacterium]|nr:hypothetical protein [Anaerolineae bacterium]